MSEHNTALLLAGAIAVIAVGGFVAYEVFFNKPTSTSTSTTTSTSTSTSVSTSTVAPQLSLISSNYNSSSQIETIQVAGRNFTYDGTVTLTEEVNSSVVTSYNVSLSSTNNFDATIPTDFSGVSPLNYNIQIYAVDNASGIQSNTISVSLNLSTTVSTSTSVNTSTSTSVNTSTSYSLGTNENPYTFDNGFVSSGFYEFSSHEYSKLSSMPASGVTSNPTFIGDSAYYNSLVSDLNYVAQSTSSISLSVSTNVVSINDTFSIFVNGLQTNESYIIYDNAGYAMTRELTGSVISYTLSQDSPIYISLYDGYDNFYAVTGNNVKSNTITLSLASTSSSTSSSSSSSSSSNAEIILSTNYLNLVQGAGLVITGTGFNPNSNFEVIANSSNNRSGGIQIAVGKTNSSGNFSVSTDYEYNETTVNGLGNAFYQNGFVNIIYIWAQTYNGSVSNIVSLTGS